MRRDPAGFRLGDLAERVGGRVEGDPDLRVAGLRSLETAGPTDLSFLTRANLAQYRKLAETSAAAALLVPPELADFDRDLLVVDKPSLALARLIPLFHPEERHAPGIHPTAVLGEACEVDPSVHVGPYAVIGDRSRLEAEVVVHAHVVIGRDCRIGAGSTVHPNAVLYDRTVLGSRVLIHAGVVLGADGFGYVFHDGAHVKVPQAGRTVIGDEVEIGANSAVDRALLEETRIGAGTKIDNLVQVGHNVRTGRGCLLCGQVGLAGSAHLGDYVVMGGQSGAAGHITLGDGLQVAGKSAVFESKPAGQKVGGVPAVELGEWRRRSALLHRLGQMFRRLRRLERRLRVQEPSESD